MSHLAGKVGTHIGYVSELHYTGKKGQVGIVLGTHWFTRP